MNRINRLLPLLNTFALKTNKNIAPENPVVSVFAKKLNSHVRYIYATPKLLDKDIVEFDEFKNLTQDKSVVKIDVREPQELKDTGVIPGSINVPLGEVEDALKKLSRAEFKKKYGGEKPDSNAHVVFSCQKGRRSQMALEIAKAAGFKNVRNYIGGWAEWEEKTK